MIGLGRANLDNKQTIRSDYISGSQKLTSLSETIKHMKLKPIAVALVS